MNKPAAEIWEDWNQKRELDESLARLKAAVRRYKQAEAGLARTVAEHPRAAAWINDRLKEARP